MNAQTALATSYSSLVPFQMGLVTDMKRTSSLFHLSAPPSICTGPSKEHRDQLLEIVYHLISTAVMTRNKRPY